MPTRLRRCDQCPGEPDGGPLTVGILLLNKPFITEFSGPLDVYHHVAAEKIKVFIVSDTDKEQVTYEGMPFRAYYTIDNAPKIDVLVVPSGAGSLGEDQQNVRVINWIKKGSWPLLVKRGRSDVLPRVLVEKAGTNNCVIPERRVRHFRR